METAKQVKQQLQLIHIKSSQHNVEGIDMYVFM